MCETCMNYVNSECVHDEGCQTSMYEMYQPKEETE